MNYEQTIIACKRFIDLDASYQAPECLFSYIKGKRAWDEAHRKYAIPIMVLFENYMAFAKRMTDTDERINDGPCFNDGWLDHDRFDPISAECVEILTALETGKEWGAWYYTNRRSVNPERLVLTEWQIRLRDWFANNVPHIENLHI